MVDWGVNIYFLLIIMECISFLGNVEFYKYVLGVGYFFFNSRIFFEGDKCDSKGYMLRGNGVY